MSFKQLTLRKEWVLKCCTLSTGQLHVSALKLVKTEYIYGSNDKKRFIKNLIDNFPWLVEEGVNNDFIFCSK